MGIFDSVNALKPQRSAFNLSYDKKLTCDLGQLIPIVCEEAVPGDTWQIGIEAVVRFLPMVAPVLHEINLYVHYFFVPNRLLWSDWEEFITGGEDGEDVHVLPRWTPTGNAVLNDNGDSGPDNGIHSLWDYMGFPVGIIPTGVIPVDFPRRAYNLVWNQYYRDETQQAEIDLDSSITKNRCWEKDFFTSALPWQQRGIAPAIPVSGTASALWNPDNIQTSAGNENVQMNSGGANVSFWNMSAQGKANLQGALETNAVDLSGLAALDVADLREVVQIQKWMERNARGGARYTSFLKNHFGESPRDERLQRAEYIGGTRMPVLVSEVLQTSQSGTTPQGNMAGHALVAGRDMCTSYKCEEHGVIIGMMSIMPRSAYSQGVPRQWLRQSRYDYYSPEWAHLSEQAIYRGEIYADGDPLHNGTIFGYQGRFNEMRSKQSMTVGLMRYGVSGSMAYWHLARNFATAPALNDAFVRCVPRKDYLAAAGPTCIVNVGNMIRAIRPMPLEPEPGLLDHF